MRVAADIHQASGFCSAKNGCREIVLLGTESSAILSPVLEKIPTLILLVPMSIESSDLRFCNLDYVLPERYWRLLYCIQRFFDGA